MRAPTDPLTPDPQTHRRDKVLAVWLLALAGMVLVMVVLGGLTRLTHSGLSMVDWRPITGWLPPLTEEAWRAVFDAYRQFPEYQELNAGMSLAEFKGIFWLEYIHRLWGRLIGVAFALPFIVFLARGWIGWRLAPRLVVVFALGAAQGVLGWYMVQSGLVDRPDVSQYRLAAHFGLALVILGALVWQAMALLAPEPAPLPARPPRLGALAVVGLVFLTALSGAFVAGTDAGFAYNTFPTMDGDWLPAELFALSPWWINLFEDIATVQFAHRVWALTTVIAVAVFWVMARCRGPTGRTRAALDVLGALAVAQPTLGVMTLVLYVPLSLAALHQAVAVLLLAAALWVAFEARPAAHTAAVGKLSARVS